MPSELTIHVILPDKIISSEAQVREKATHETELGEYFFAGLESKLSTITFGFTWLIEFKDLQYKSLPSTSLQCFKIYLKVPVGMKIANSETVGPKQYLYHCN